MAESRRAGRVCSWRWPNSKRDSSTAVRSRRRAACRHSRVSRPVGVRAADDGGTEIALALSLAGSAPNHDAAGRPIDSVRAHWLPIDRFGHFVRRDKRLAQDPRVVVTGRDAEGDLVRILQRRLVEAASGAGRVLSLRARPGTEAHSGDVLRLLNGQADLERTLWLARAFAALDWSAFAPAHHGPVRRAPGERVVADPAWAALRLCHLSGPLPDGRRVPVDPAILRLLSTGDASRAFALVTARLRGAGIRVPFSAVNTTPERARTMAASLAFPLSLRTTARLVRELDPQAAPTAQETHHVD
jgi:CRISPR-associated protein Csx17